MVGLGFTIQGMLVHGLVAVIELEEAESSDGAVLGSDDSAGLLRGLCLVIYDAFLR